MPTYGGWTGKTLRVDLTTRKSTVEDTLAKYGEWWGGTGMGYKVLWDETTGTTDPLGPDNKIIFGWGPLTGTGAPCGGRTCITALSPQHPFGAVATGHMGGHFSAEAKYAGWDGIIVEGKASNPVYIAIHDDNVKIVDAPQLWGNGIYRVTAEIVEAMGGGSCQVAAIGQAGQNLVAQSVVMTGYSHSAGGQGAVMGSKNLLGIGVVGSGSVKIAGSTKSWRQVIDYAMSLVGSNNQAVVPNTPQPWAEYTGSSSVRWYATKGKYWGAAEPPVETGTCEPHDRQSVGYRCFKSDPGAFAEQFTVRMDGCHACPVRCHQDLNVPTAAKWGVDPTASNTCTGWWGRGLMDAAKIKAAAGSKVQDQNLMALESYVVGKHMTDDLGLHNNYGTTDRGWTFILLQGPAGTATHPTADLTTLKTAGKAAVKLSWLQTVLINPTWDWTTVTGAAAGAEYATLAGTTSTAAATTLLGQYANGDLNFLMNFGKIMANQTGALGRFLAGPVERGLGEWEVKAPGLTAAYHEDHSVLWWNNGFPKHHSLENGAQVGALINIGYNRDSQNHCWSNYLSCGLPTQLQRDIATELFANAGYTKAANGDSIAMGDAVDPNNTASPMNRAKAVAAIWATARKELMDSTGLCSWMWPWIPSPLRERNYRGDIGLEAKLFSIATGRNMTTKEFDREGVKFYILQRALTERSFKAQFTDGTKTMRTLHDGLPPWGYIDDSPGKTAFDGTNYYITHADWETALDYYYEEIGFDKATGLVTRATLESYGMKSVADQLATLGLLPTA